MRAIVDWYFTAHPPIMHDLHESQPLLYTYSGAAPQNPNLDPILFAELPWFSNFELAQMTKWGMPGVYTHAFMDGWSPGYLGSVAYNHNGMMRMYETQGGNDVRPASGTLGRGGPRAAAGGAGAGVEAPDAAGRGGAPGRSGGAQRAHGTRWLPATRVVSRNPDSARRAQQLVPPQQRQLHGDRRPLGSPADGHSPRHRRRELLSQDHELD